jgi:hypothetical protein
LNKTKLHNAKKHFLNAALVSVAMLMMTSCGGSANKEEAANNDEATEQTSEQAEAESEDESTGYKPPFSFVVSDIREAGTYRDRYTFHYTLKANGMYTITQQLEIAALDQDNWKMYEGYPKTYEGKWTTTSRSVGDHSQTVYEIHRAEFGNFVAHSEFLPDDCEYIWIPSMTPASWEECEDFDTHNAMKVTEFKKG